MLTTQLEGCVAKGCNGNRTRIRHYLIIEVPGARPRDPQHLIQHQHSDTTRGLTGRVQSPHLTGTTRSGMPFCSFRQFACYRARSGDRR
jgi:hypothetical protein